MITNFKRLMLLSLLVFSLTALFGMQEGGPSQTPQTLSALNSELSRIRYQISNVKGEIKRDKADPNNNPDFKSIPKHNDELRALQSREKEVIEALANLKNL